MLSSLVAGIQSAGPGALQALQRGAVDFGHGFVGAPPAGGVPAGAMGPSLPAAGYGVPHAAGDFLGMLDPGLRGMAQNVMQPPTGSFFNQAVQWAKPLTQVGGPPSRSAAAETIPDKGGAMLSNLLSPSFLRGQQPQPTGPPQRVGRQMTDPALWGYPALGMY